MTGYDRIMLALERKPADRVPLAEFGIDDKVFKQIMPDVQTEGDFQAAMEFDAVCCGVSFFPTDQRPDGTFVDEWGVTYKPNAEMKHHPIDHPLKTYEDLRDYTAPDPDRPGRLGDLPDLVAKYKGRHAIVFGQRACFMWSAYLRGIDNLLMDFICEPDFVHKLLDMDLAVHLGIAANAIDAGADVILLLDDLATNAGPFFSPALFAEFIQPRLKKMVDFIHARGAKVIKHCDGNVWPILDMMVETGIDGLHPIDPIAGMDIGAVKAHAGDRICVVGNIDCGPLLTFGQPAEVKQAVIDCIAKASHGGGHILTSSNSIHSSVKPENYLAMIDAVREHGRLD